MIGPGSDKNLFRFLTSRKDIFSAQEKKKGHSYWSNTTSNNGKMAPKTRLGPLESDFLFLGYEEKDSSQLAKIRDGFFTSGHYQANSAKKYADWLPSGLSRALIKAVPRILTKSFTFVLDHLEGEGEKQLMI